MNNRRLIKVYEEWNEDVTKKELLAEEAIKHFEKRRNEEENEYLKEIYNYGIRKAETILIEQSDIRNTIEKRLKELKAWKERLKTF